MQNLDIIYLETSENFQYLRDQEVLSTASSFSYQFSEQEPIFQEQEHIFSPLQSSLDESNQSQSHLPEQPQQNKLVETFWLDLPFQLFCMDLLFQFFCIPLLYDLIPWLKTTSKKIKIMIWLSLLGLSLSFSIQTSCTVLALLSFNLYMCHQSPQQKTLNQAHLLEIVTKIQNIKKYMVVNRLSFRQIKMCLGLAVELNNWLQFNQAIKQSQDQPDFIFNIFFQTVRIIENYLKRNHSQKILQKNSQKYSKLLSFSSKLIKILDALELIDKTLLSDLISKRKSPLLHNLQIKKKNLYYKVLMQRLNSEIQDDLEHRQNGQQKQFSKVKLQIYLNLIRKQMTLKTLRFLSKKVFSGQSNPRDEKTQILEQIVQDNNCVSCQTKHMLHHLSRQNDWMEEIGLQNRADIECEISKIFEKKAGDRIEDKVKTVVAPLKVEFERRSVGFGIVPPKRNMSQFYIE